MESFVQPNSAGEEDQFDVNLPEVSFDLASINDDDLLLAQQQCMESGSLTPLLKQELRYKIQSRRLTEGKDELLVDFVSPQNCQLTSEDMERRRRRQEQNRRAAQRFRQRRKLQGKFLQQEVDQLVQKNAILSEKLRELEEEKKRLQDVLNAHIAVCEHPFNMANLFFMMP